MPEKKVNKCMICGKEHDGHDSICNACACNIRGEAVGQRRKVAKAASKAMKPHGRKEPMKG